MEAISSREGYLVFEDMLSSGQKDMMLYCMVCSELMCRVCRTTRAVGAYIVFIYHGENDAGRVRSLIPDHSTFSHCEQSRSQHDTA
jgi:hypothetical protein